MTSFDESLHPRGQAANAGQFATKTNTAPTGTLASAGASTATLLEERATAAALHLAARDAYLRANKAAAIATLREQFPDASLVIFSRSLDEDEVKLHQILGNTDYDLTEIDDYNRLTAAQKDAYQSAQVWIQEMGDDVGTYIDEGGEDHDGWYEYQLDLSEQPFATSPVEKIVDQVSAAERSKLDTALSERDGRMISTVDTNEITYQLDEGLLAETDPDVVARLETQFGSLDSAARNIANTHAWSGLREDVDGYVRNHMFDAIVRAADELNPETL
ncbi:MAG: hypothetical protein J0J04_08535 [Microbacterium sp.]|uniref:hypothetical protein n=1 Tax=Microbacterium sp. TaxID=51671 RepID=UPI001AD095C4|nr:hypothetical protein [Microbacterium sp.]MBN9214823.1 hypothetical protein [Microbacterium sp.]